MYNNTLITIYKIASFSQSLSHLFCKRWFHVSKLNSTRCEWNWKAIALNKDSITTIKDKPF